MSYDVTKTMHFCYGHRLLNYEGKCRFLHGHNALVEITLTSDTLDERGMVTDFSDVKRTIQAWLDSELDHKMILNAQDPIIPQLEASQEPFVTVQENPTAETLAKLVFEQAEKAGFPVTQVKLWETPSSFATYRK